MTNALQGPTHRLEIHAPTAAKQELVPNRETELRMSDLGSEGRDGRGEEPQEAGASVPDRNRVEEKIRALQSEVDSLKTNIKGELLPLQPSLTGSRVQGLVEVPLSRDQLLSKLVEVEMESSAISKQVSKLQESVERLEPVSFMRKGRSERKGREERERRREGEGGREGKRERGREGGREGGTEGGRDGGREGGREIEREREREREIWMGGWIKNLIKVCKIPHKNYFKWVGKGGQEGNCPPPPNF